MTDKLHSGNVDWYLSRFSEYERSLNGKSNGALHHLKREAIEKFSGQGFPTTKDEEWKYTNLSQMLADNFNPFVTPDISTIKLPRLFSGQELTTIVLVNGKLIREKSDINHLPDFMQVEALSSLPENDVVRLISSSPSEDVFTNLNTAFFQDGVYIRIMNNYIEKKPLHILNVTRTNGNQPLCQPRTILHIETGANARILETFIGTDGESYFTNPVSTYQLADNASVEHYRVQLDGDHAYHISNTEVHLERAANFVSHSISIGSLLNRNDYNVVLSGEDANCTLNGLYIGDKEQLIDNRTLIAHTRPHCTSTQVYKGILDQKARGVFNGKIHVYPDAQKTNAIQSNNCLLLSDDAVMNAKPQLEIYADDVRCTHGATVGQLDSEAYFYLQSRGIDRKTAQGMLIHAFASDVLTSMSLESVKNWVTALFVKKLHTIKVE